MTPVNALPNFLKDTRRLKKCGIQVSKAIQTTDRQQNHAASGNYFETKGYEATSALLMHAVCSISANLADQKALSANLH